MMLDVCGALAASGIQYQPPQSGSWIRIRAEWREGKNKNVAVNTESGGWIDHVTGDHGSWSDLCARLGIACPKPTTTWTDEDRQLWRERKARQKQREQDATSRRVARARRIWAEALNVSEANIWARDYLTSRGLDPDAPGLAAVVRTTEGWSSQRGARLPALVWPMFAPDGTTIMGVQYEFGRGHTNKEMRGQHGHFWLGPLIGDTLYIVEGQMTGAALSTAVAPAPVLVVFDTHGLRTLPSETVRRITAGGITRVVIAADHDRVAAGTGKRPGEEAALACLTRLLDVAPALQVQITLPPYEGEDWADIHQQRGPDAVRAALAAGMRDVKPQSVPGYDIGTNILSLTPWQRTERTPSQDWPTLSDVEPQICRAIGQALDSTDPAIVVAQPGTGKTHVAIDRVRMGTQPVLWLSPTLDEAAAVAAQIPGAHLHRGRNGDNCRQYQMIDALTNRGRAPYPWACATCNHGRVDSDDPCEYMQSLRGSVYKKVVVGAHGAGAEDSLLYLFCADPNADREARKLVVDESPAVNRITRIAPEDLAQWRIGSAEAGARLVDPPALPSDADAEARKHHEAACRAVERARVWVAEITPELNRLALALAAAQADHDLYKLTGFEQFAELAANIPPGARLLDATVIEAVRGRHGLGPDLMVPLRGIENLGTAIVAGTAWIQEGALITTNAGTLWTQILTRGGALLDATPSLRQREEVLAVGGEVHTIRAATPMLRLTQFGPRLHGRGGLTPKRLSQEARAVREIAGTDPVITHRPIASVLNKESDDAPRQFGHWGRDHRAHNRWKEADRLVLWGLPLLSPNEQRIQYLSDRSALAAQGIDWPDWDGSASGGQVVPTDGWLNRYAARLPTEPQARAWVLDRLAADVAQGVGRLRAVRRKGPVQVEIYGFLPLVGHGLRIKDVRLEKAGRAHQKTTTRKLVSEAIVDLGEQRTRKGISDYVYSKGGGRISNQTIDNMLDETRVYAQRHGLTLIDAARTLCQITNDLLREHGNDAMAACLAADAAGIPGAALLALVIEQGRRAQEAPGVQRAGP